MNLSKKKKLAKKTFGVGSERIVFLESRLDEIKDAITKQDIRDLEKSGAIIVLSEKGRAKVSKRKSRSAGNIRKKMGRRKRGYIIITRKLRQYLQDLYSRGEISNEDLESMRKRIRNKEFRSKVHLKEYIRGIRKEK